MRRLMNSLRISSGLGWDAMTLATIGVSTVPGQTTFTRCHRGVIGRHRLGQSDQGCLGGAVGGAAAQPLSPASEETLMITPDFLSSMWGRTKRLTR